jgi:ribosomal-protein-alanine N-acetyltransferase
MTSGERNGLSSTTAFGFSRNSKPETRNRILHIRRATTAEIPSMMALEKHAATAAHWSQEQYEKVLSGTSEVLVLEDGPAILGFLVGRRIDSEWEIENVAIAGHERRRGWGTRLVAEFLNQARAQGAKSIFLEVRESNQAARSLYEKLAFRENGRRKRYYREPEEDAILYHLDLP